jgi:hypothetical protein
MQTPLARLLLAALALGMAACHGSVSSPTSPSLPNTFTLTATMSDTDGVAHMIEAQVAIDGTVLASSCPPAFEAPIYDTNGNLVGYACQAPAVASYTFITGGGIAPGSHTIQFYLVTQQGSGTYSYTVSAVKLQIYDATGTTLQKTITLPNQTSAIPTGQAITYNFSF